MEEEKVIKLSEITAKAFGVAKPTEPQKTEALKALCSMDNAVVDSKPSLPLLCVTGIEETEGEIYITIELEENPEKKPENELEKRIYSILIQQ